MKRALDALLLVLLLVLFAGNARGQFRRTCVIMVSVEGHLPSCYANAGPVFSLLEDVNQHLIATTFAQEMLVVSPTIIRVDLSADQLGDACSVADLHRRAHFTIEQMQANSSDPTSLVQCSERVYVLPETETACERVSAYGVCGTYCHLNLRGCHHADNLEEVLYYFYSTVGMHHVGSYYLETGKASNFGDPLTVMGKGYLSASDDSNDQFLHVDSANLAERGFISPQVVTGSGVYTLVAFDSSVSSELSRVLKVNHPIVRAVYYVAFWKNATVAGMSMKGQVHSISDPQRNNPWFIASLDSFGLPFLDFTSSMQIQQLGCADTNLTCDYSISFSCQTSAPEIIVVTEAISGDSDTDVIYYDQHTLELSVGDGSSGICWPGFTYVFIDAQPVGWNAELENSALFLQPGQRCTVALKVDRRGTAASLPGVVSLRAVNSRGEESRFSMGFGCPEEPRPLVTFSGYSRRPRLVIVDFSVSWKCKPLPEISATAPCGWTAQVIANSQIRMFGDTECLNGTGTMTINSQMFSLPVISPCVDEVKVRSEVTDHSIDINLVLPECNEAGALWQINTAVKWANGSIPSLELQPQLLPHNQEPYDIAPLSGVPPGSQVALFSENARFRFLFNLTQSAQLSTEVAGKKLKFDIVVSDSPPVCNTVAPRVNWYCKLPPWGLLPPPESTFCSVSLTNMDWGAGCYLRRFRVNLTNTLNLPQVVSDGPWDSRAALAAVHRGPPGGWGWGVDIQLSPNITEGQALAVDLRLEDEPAKYRSPSTVFESPMTTFDTCRHAAPLLEPQLTQDGPFRVALHETLVLPVKITVSHSALCYGQYLWVWEKNPLGLNFTSEDLVLQEMPGIRWPSGRSGTMNLRFTPTSLEIPLDTPFHFHYTLYDNSDHTYNATISWALEFYRAPCIRGPYKFSVEPVPLQQFTWNVTLQSNDTVACGSHGVDIRMLGFPVNNPDPAHVYVNGGSFNPGWWSFESVPETLTLIPGGENASAVVRLVNSEGAPPGSIDFPMGIQPRDGHYMHRPTEKNGGLNWIHYLKAALRCPIPPPVTYFETYQFTPVFSPKTAVRLRWTAPCSRSRCCWPLSYYVYRNGVLIASQINTTIWTDEELPSGSSFEYRIQTADVNGLRMARNESSCDAAFVVVIEHSDPLSFILLFLGVLVFVILVIIIAVLIYKTRKIDLEIRRLQRFGDMRELGRIEASRGTGDSDEEEEETVDMVKLVTEFEPRDADDLSVVPGDEIKVLYEDPHSVWWKGQSVKDGSVGYFDSRSTTALPPSLPSGMATDFSVDQTDDEADGEENASLL